jgi:hypothetical protein
MVQANIVTIKNIATIIGLAAVAGFGGGFLLGVADHKGPEAVMAFADQHIAFPWIEQDRDALLVFSCDSPQPLVIYDLLSDQIFNKKEQIAASLENMPNKFLESDLFSHSVAFLPESFGVFFSVKDEVKAWKAGESTVKRLGFVGLVLAPTGYLGYLASDQFKLECSSRFIFERLAAKSSWAPHRLDAAKVLFDQLAYCIDRQATLSDSDVLGLDSLLLHSGIGDNPFNPIHDTAPEEIEQWRSYISVVNEGVPQREVIEGRFQKNFGADQQAASWGDSIYQRIYGTEGFVAANSDFDKIDFRALIAADRECSKLNRDKAKDLYRLAVAEPDDKVPGSLATYRLARLNSFQKNRLRLAESAQFTSGLIVPPLDTFEPHN